MKSYVKTMNKTLCKLCSLFLVCVFILSSFSGCSGEIEHSTEYSDEELQNFSEKIKIDEIMGHTVPTKKLECFYDEYAPDKEYTTTEMEFETVTVRGVEYKVYKYKDSDTGETVTAPVCKTPYPRTDDYLYRVQVQEGNGYNLLKYVGDNQIPIYHTFPVEWYYEEELVRNDWESLDVESAEKKARSFVEELYSDVGLDVDMSEYTTIGINATSYSIRFRWARFEKNVLFHAIEVTTNYYGDVHIFNAGGVPPSEEVITKIPDLTSTQYIDIATRFLNEHAESLGIKDGAKIKSLSSYMEYHEIDLSFDDIAFQLKYSASLGKYMIAFAVRGETTYDYGEKYGYNVELLLLLD